MAVDFAAEEARTLKRWKEIDAFQTQVRLSLGNKPYTFYDGPVSVSLVSVIRFSLSGPRLGAVRSTSYAYQIALAASSS